MSEFDKKWIFYLCIVLAITFLLGRAAYWTLTYVFGTAVVGEDGESLIQVSGVIEVIRKLVTPVLLIGGVMLTTAAYSKHKNEDVER